MNSVNGLLNSAIRAEINAQYRRGIACYSRLSKHGSALDRIGVYQAIARCYERVGSPRLAGRWHERAGEGYNKLPTRIMGKQEAAYYALVEFHAALQNYAPNFRYREALAGRYLHALRICLRNSKEGYSHEMLFAAHLWVKLRRFKEAAKMFKEVGVQFKAEGQRRLARESFLLSQQHSRKTNIP